MKICTKCQVPQPLENFNNNKNFKDGKNCQCKSCGKQYREENKEKLSLKKKQYVENNKECIRLRQKQWRDSNKENLILYRENNKEKLSLRHKQWCEENKEELALKNKKYREENKEIIILKRRQYYEENKEKITLRTKQWCDDNKEKTSLNKKRYRIRHKDKLNVKRELYRKSNKEKIAKKTKEYKNTIMGKCVARNAKHKRRTITKQGDVTTIQLTELLDNATHCFYCNNPLVLNETHIDHYIPLSKGGEHTITNLRVSCQKCNLQKGHKIPEEFRNKYFCVSRTQEEKTELSEKLPLTEDIKVFDNELLKTVVYNRKED